MGAVTYPDSMVAEFINNRTAPVRMLYDAQPYASDYNIKWTPTALILDETGKEHHRITGFLPPDEFIPALLLGIAKCAFDRDDLNGALSDLDKLLTGYPKSAAAPEALYLRGVIQFKEGHKPEALKTTFERLRQEYPSSEWTKRAMPYGLL